MIDRPPNLKVYRSRHAPGCEHCKTARKDLMVVWHVRPATAWGEDRYDAAAYTRVVCVNREACVARREKREARTRQRSQMLVLEKPKAPEARRGWCRWCGGPIWRPDGGLDKRRNYHYGKQSELYGGTPRAGEPDCMVAFQRSRTWDARIALRRVAPEGRVVCVDCGVVCEERGSYGGVPWEADHEVPLEDGGEHVIENLRARCVVCHRAKTGRENAARAAARRG